jgi:hypothetical protein
LQERHHDAANRHPLAHTAIHALEDAVDLFERLRGVARLDWTVPAV